VIKDAEIVARLRATYPVLTLDELRALPEAEEYDGGVYFLWRANDLQYIGRSSHILDRLTWQSTVNRMDTLMTSRHVAIPFDRHTCIVLERGYLKQPRTELLMKDYERLYIGTYPTPYNDPSFLGYT